MRASAARARFSRSTRMRISSERPASAPAGPQKLGGGLGLPLPCALPERRAPVARLARLGLLHLAGERRGDAGAAGAHAGPVPPLGLVRHQPAEHGAGRLGRREVKGGAVCRLGRRRLFLLRRHPRHGQRRVRTPLHQQVLHHLRLPGESRELQERGRHGRRGRLGLTAPPPRGERRIDPLCGVVAPRCVPAARAQQVRLVPGEQRVERVNLAFAHHAHQTLEPHTPPRLVLVPACTRRSLHRRRRRCRRMRRGVRPERLRDRLALRVGLRSELLRTQMRDLDAGQLKEAAHNLAQRRPLRRERQVRELAAGQRLVERRVGRARPVPQHATCGPHAGAHPHPL